jgi:hypothetical protein
MRGELAVAPSREHLVPDNADLPDAGPTVDRERPEREQVRGVVTELGNGGGNETLGDQARRLRHRGRHGRR